jgi:fluoride exporter
MLVNLVLVAAGSAVGGSLRYLLSLALSGRAGAMPIATLVVNVVGSLAIGILAASAPLSPRMRLLAATGFCGGFTTFSAFSLETLALARDGASFLALANIALNVVLSLAACWIGWRAAS